jgi:hypothetical protein
MFFKDVSYQKREDEIHSPCVHNTKGIPREKVIASFKDVPVVEIKYNYASLEERTDAEVLAIIGCMNKQGKFVPKEWVCNALNFKSRKADDILTNLKRAGKIVELRAQKGGGKKHGHYYRLAGNRWKRIVQREHAKIRRFLRREACEIHNKESCKLSQKGSLISEQPFSNPSQTPEEIKLINNEEVQNQAECTGESLTDFSPVKKIKLRTEEKRKLNHECGAPGNGMENTCYTTTGCFARLTDDLNNKEEFDMVENLAAVSREMTFLPILSRSICRRIDNGTITPDTVARVVNIITDNKLCLGFNNIILNFEKILAENTEKIVQEELGSMQDDIKKMTSGSEPEQAHAKIVRLYNKYLPLKKLPHNHPDLTFKELALSLNLNIGVPAYAKLAAMYHLGISDATMEQLCAAMKGELFRDLVADKTALHHMKEVLKFKWVNWNEFKDFRIKFIDDLRGKLFVNKFRSVNLDNYSRRLHYYAKIENYVDRQYFDK